MQIFTKTLIMSLQLLYAMILMGLYIMDLLANSSMGVHEVSQWTGPGMFSYYCLSFRGWAQVVLTLDQKTKHHSDRTSKPNNKSM